MYSTQVTIGIVLQSVAILFSIGVHINASIHLLLKGIKITVKKNYLVGAFEVQGTVIIKFNAKFFIEKKKCQTKIKRDKKKFKIIKKTVPFQLNKMCQSLVNSISKSEIIETFEKN